MSNSKRSRAASRARRSRTARNNFLNRYGGLTYDVVSLLAKGTPSTTVANKYWIDERSVAAFKANYTRGTYSPYVSPSGGSCNF